MINRLKKVVVPALAGTTTIISLPGSAFAEPPVGTLYKTSSVCNPNREQKESGWGTFGKFITYESDGGGGAVLRMCVKNTRYRMILTKNYDGERASGDFMRMTSNGDRFAWSTQSRGKSAVVRIFNWKTRKLSTKFNADDQGEPGVVSLYLNSRGSLVWETAIENATVPITMTNVRSYKGKFSTLGGPYTTPMYTSGFRKTDDHYFDWSIPDQLEGPVISHSAKVD